MNYLVSDYRNPNTFGNGSWTSTYWPLYSSYNKEYLSLNIHNKTVGHGVRSRKCAFWHSYLPSLLSKYPTTYNQDFMKQILVGLGLVLLPKYCIWYKNEVTNFLSSCLSIWLCIRWFHDFLITFQWHNYLTSPTIIAINQVGSILTLNPSSSSPTRLAITRKNRL